MDSGYILKVGGAVGFVDGLKISCEKEGGVRFRTQPTQPKSKVAIMEVGKQEFAFECVKCDL